MQQDVPNSRIELIWRAEIASSSPPLVRFKEDLNYVPTVKTTIVSHLKPIPILHMHDLKCVKIKKSLL